MLRRGGLLAIALVLVIGAIVLVLRRGDSSRHVASATRQSTNAESGVAARLESATQGMGRLAPDTPVSAESVPPRDHPTEDDHTPPIEPRFGFVFGQVLDDQGQVAEGRRVVFRRAPGVVAKQHREATSDSEGFYRDRDDTGSWREPPAVRLETGHWYVFCDEQDERVWDGLVSRRLMGTVEVAEDQMTQFDVHFAGGRTLLGVLDYDDPLAEEDGGTMLHVQLFSLWRPEEPVGDAVIGYSKGKPWFNVDLPEEEMRARLAEQGKEYPKYEMGAFKFSGLRAEPHVLRVLLDVEGKLIYEYEVDLSSGDVDTGKIPLEDSMFWFRALPNVDHAKD